MLVLRPASWLALLSRTFTFELSLAGSPRANVEYDYVGKQSIPTTGLSPASPTALWAAEPDLTPWTSRAAVSGLRLRWSFSSVPFASAGLGVNETDDWIANNHVVMFTVFPQ